MTYGDLAENYEFAAMKSTGISLQRAMRGLIVFHILLGIGSFFFANHVIPYGELKSYNLRKNLAKLKPALAIREGIFNDLGSISIKVEDKYGEEDRFLTDVIIHEKSPDNQNRIVIKAKRGELKSASIDQELQLVLFDGNRYEEVYTKKVQERKRIQHAKVAFKEYVLNIDLSQFNNVDLGEEKYTSTFRMQKADELTYSIDSLEIKFKSEQKTYGENFVSTSISNNINYNEAEKDITTTDSVFQLYSNPLKIIGDSIYNRHSDVLRGAKNSIKSLQRNLTSKKKIFFINQKRINLHKNSLHEKYTLGFSVFFLFLVGASLEPLLEKAD